MASVREVKGRLQKKLRKQSGVVGVGITKVNRNGFNVDAIKVNFRNRESLLQAKLPSETEGIPIVTEVIGQVTAGQV